MSLSDTHKSMLKSELFMPEVATDMFRVQDSAAFWIGVVATPELVMEPEIFTAARSLRAGVYIDKNNFLPESARQSDGGETDSDDPRSVHFVVVEKSDPISRLVGTSRLIMKNNKNEPLPVERYFPEAFHKSDASVNPAEVSRFIAQHPNKSIQRAISLSLIRAMAFEAFENGSRPVYAVIEANFARLLKGVGLPFEQITATKQIEAYHNTQNMAVKFEPEEVFTTAMDGKAEILSTFFRRSPQLLGLGYYDQSLIAPTLYAGENQ